MSGALEFTPAQRALIEADESVYVEACPGAGKTQAIVQRFIDRPGSHPRRGVGLISFTNAAIDEARSRCGDNPGLLVVPNFVGTIDAFINRFFIAPVYRSRRRTAPTFRDTWATVPGTTVTSAGLEAQLDWFDFDASGNAQLQLRRIPWSENGSARKRLKSQEPWMIKKLEANASGLWRRMVAKGIFDADASRICLTKYLADGYRDHYMSFTRARFSEIIVDEVQDCSREDVAVLELLLDAGVRLVMVGDPDQAIYGFRGNPADDRLTELLGRVKRGTPLDGNFRSSPAICKAVDSLRHGNRSDVPVGKHRSVRSPVYLLRYTTDHDAHDAVEKLRASLGIERSEVVTLAHRPEKARGIAGAPAAMDPKSSKLVRLAMLIHRVQDEHSPGAIRVRALRALERHLIELCPTDLSDMSHQEYLDSRGLTSQQFRERCLRLAMTSPAPFDIAPSEFKAHLASRADSQEVLGWSLRGVNRPSGDIWPSKPATTVSALPYSTIHGYKGLQSPAVVLVLPRPSPLHDEDGVQQWCSGQPGEARRVLYVGASRAQKLLVIAAHESVYDDVAATLKEDGVRAQVMDASEALHLTSANPSLTQHPAILAADALSEAAGTVSDRGEPAIPRL
ncbi:ATP-dependent helicase (plasmid) [Prescottella equi]|uniref:ATP-dependent helicase n=1 Tax=Rhodococcus hoagii TaxID=43767 RepID=UPI00257766E8|nr:ATP-dependent helicase [Prescottella equi]WJJ14520.1 ATP-dependent helicase [Prescottella equi]